jgi:DNA-binding transcriptional LysR family regulator
MGAAMELRHLRYFVAVADSLNFTKAAAKLRVAQPALSRQVLDLEDEIGVDLFQRSPRGVALTAEGKLFLEEARKILEQTDEVVAKTRALARGEFGELHIGYAPSPTTELLPPALANFQRTVPRVSVRLHDLAGNELGDGLRAGRLHFAVMHRPFGANAVGLDFELLRSYPICVAAAPGHALMKLKNVPLARLTQEKLVALRQKEYADYHEMLARVFAPAPPPSVAIECDSASSLITEVESGQRVAVLPQVFSRVIGKRLKLRPLTPEPAPFEVGIVRAVKGDVTPAGEKFCQQLRAIAGR